MIGCAASRLSTWRTEVIMTIGCCQRRVIAAVLAALSVLSFDPAFASYRGDPRWGVWTTLPPSAPVITDLGVGAMRVNLDWHQVQPAPPPVRHDVAHLASFCGSINWGLSPASAQIDAARARGLELYVNVGYAPNWAAVQSGGNQSFYMPSDPLEWGMFLYCTFQRFGAEGILYGIWAQPTPQMLHDDSSGSGIALLMSWANLARNYFNPSIRLGGLEAYEWAYYDRWDYFGGGGSYVRNALEKFAAQNLLAAQDVVLVGLPATTNSTLSSRMGVVSQLVQTYVPNHDIWLTAFLSPDVHTTVPLQIVFLGGTFPGFSQSPRWTRTFVAFVENHLTDPTGTVRHGGYEALKTRIRKAIAPGAVLINTWTGHYLSAEWGGGDVVNANRIRPGAWETFELIDVNGGSLRHGETVQFKSIDGSLFRAEYNWYIFADSYWQPSPDTQFTVWKLDAGVSPCPSSTPSCDAVIRAGDRVAFYAPTANGFWQAPGGGGSGLGAFASFPYSWETFYLTNR